MEKDPPIVSSKYCRMFWRLASTAVDRVYAEPGKNTRANGGNLVFFTSGCKTWNGHFNAFSNVDFGN